MAKRTTKKSTPTKSSSSNNSVRRIDPGRYKSFQLQSRIKHSKPKIIGAFKLFRICIKLLIKNWKLFGGILLIYIALDIILVKGLSSGTSIPALKSTLHALFAGRTGDLTTGVTLYGFLIGSAGSTPSDLASAYQAMLLVVVSLVLIWSLRQVLANKKIGIRDAFYKGLYPVVPFLLVLLVVALQFLPLIIGAFLYGIVFGNGLAVTDIEKILWGLFLFLLAVLSLYMVCSSIFALYIVTLPDMRPMQALRSARELVLYRRWIIMRKVLFLPVALLVIAGVIMIPILLYLTVVAQWAFFALTMLTLAVIHSYMYSLYRELL